MEKKQRKPRREHDFSLTALRVVEEATDQVEPEQAKPRKPFDAKALGHKGGLKGGKARAERLTSEQRKEIAKKAAQIRWQKQSNQAEER